MAAITATSLVFGGVLAAPAAVASSDTIARAQFGATGVVLIVANGSGGSINVTVSDPGTTPLGNAGTASAVAVADGTSKLFLIPVAAVNASTGVATVSYSGTTSVTYELYKV